MKLTIYDRAASRPHPSHTSRPSHRGVPGTGQDRVRRNHQFYSAGHIHMFRALRGEGYSWRQIALICGTPPHAPRNAVARADQGATYPPVTLTVLTCRRERVGRPAGRRLA